MRVFRHFRDVVLPGGVAMICACSFSARHHHFYQFVCVLLLPVGLVGMIIWLFIVCCLSSGHNGCLLFVVGHNNGHNGCLLFVVGHNNSRNNNGHNVRFCYTNQQL